MQKMGWRAQQGVACPLNRHWSLVLAFSFMNVSECESGPPLRRVREGGRCTRSASRAAIAMAHGCRPAQSWHGVYSLFLHVPGFSPRRCTQYGTTLRIHAAVLLYRYF